MRASFFLLLAAVGCGGNANQTGDDLGGGNGDLAGMKAPDLRGADLAGADLTMAGGGDMASGGGDLSMGGGDMAMNGAPQFTTIFTILLENTDYNSIVGSNNAPYINSLIKQYGLATMYMDSGSHPSLPNYLYLVSGDTQYAGFVDLNPTDSCGPNCKFPVDKPNLGDQMQKAGIKWRSYQESAPSDCALAPAGTYAPKHDGFLYFKNIQLGANGLCAQTNPAVDLSKQGNAFEADLAAGTYRYMWFTPNLNDDGHDTNLQTADTWLSNFLPKILNSATYKNGGVVFITWDEGSGQFNTGDHIPMIVVSPKAKPGFQSAKPYTHASYLATVEDSLGLPRLGAAMNAQPLFEFFQ